MGHETIKFLTRRKAALLASEDHSTFARKARRGIYPLRKVNGRWLVEVAALEHTTGRTFTPAQVEAAARAPTPGYVPANTFRGRKYRAARVIARAQRLQPALVDQIVERADARWTAWLASKIEQVAFPAGPPYECELNDTLDREAEELIICARDAQWHKFIRPTRFSAIAGYRSVPPRYQLGV